MANLTPKQQRFADEYLVDLNATQAAKRAGYKDPNIGRQLITNNNVSAYIEQRRAKLQEKTEVSQERVITELAKIGFASITDYLEYKTALRVIDHDENGNPIHDWAMLVNAIDSAEVDGSPIQEVSISKDGTFKFKLYSKLDALEKLARHLGLYNDSAAAKDTREDDNLFDAVEKAVAGDEV